MSLSLNLILEPLVKLRNSLYDKKVFSTEKMPVPVVSIGNITMGGTGKTPFTLWLIQLLRNQNLKVGVVVRSYKAGLKSPKKVTTGYNDIRHFGDEAVLLALKNTDVTVWAGPNKTQTAKALLKEESVDILIVDDGFQHRRLHRDLDIVLLDSSVAASDYQFPMLGRARETYQSLDRADVIVFTKLEQKNSETLKILEQWVQSLDKKVVLKSQQVFNRPQFFAGKLAEWQEQKNIFAFAGIGNPSNFKKSLESAGLSFSDFLPLPDHAIYDVDLIKSLALRAKGKVAITTEKDSVKLQDWPIDGPPLFVFPMNITFDGPIGDLREQIDRILKA